MSAGGVCDRREDLVVGDDPLGATLSLEKIVQTLLRTQVVVLEVEHLHLAASSSRATCAP